MSGPDKPVSTADPDYAPRERGLKRRDLFLDAAAEAFVESGFEATSLQDIVARAGGSLATLYRLFGNKEGLFQAVIERKFKSVFGNLELPRTAGGEPERVLFNLGIRLLTMILSDEAIGIHRLMIAESKRNPRLGEIFMELAPNRAARVLADYFRHQTAAGVLDIRDPKLAATQFLEMIKGDIYMRRILGEQVSVDEQERRRRVEHAVHVFLEGVRPRP